MTDSEAAAPTRAAGQVETIVETILAKTALAQLKVNTALSLKRVPIACNRPARRFHRSRAAFGRRLWPLSNTRKLSAEEQQGRCQQS
jgi:hypothetical protein